MAFCPKACHAACEAKGEECCKSLCESHLPQDIADKAKELGWGWAKLWAMLLQFGVPALEQLLDSLLAAKA